MTQSKSKTCQNCKAKFIIEPEDFEFYKKIDVPEPTFCPDCRMQRRMASWNERKLYKRNCDLCKKPTITIYSPDKPFKVYCSKCWWSDKWDAMKYGKNYNFSKSFFQQFYQLQQEVPVVNLLNTHSQNSEYCHDFLYGKDCYLSFLGGISENCSYATWFADDKDCMDIYRVLDSELCYFSIGCSRCYKLFFSQDCSECHSSAFLFNCRNCENCFGCVNLRHKKYHIFNRPYKKEKYLEKLKEFNLGSYQEVLKIKEKFNNFHIKFPRKFAKINKTVNVTGDDMANAKNCHYCFSGDKGAENCKYAFITGLNIKDSYDIYDTGYFVNLTYESVCVVDKCNHMLFDNGVWTSRDVQYSEGCHDSSDLFGCISLRKKKYCILNKQYNKEDYKKLIKKIKEQMDKVPYIDRKGRIYKYGEYFPIELSRFGYNESPVLQYFPLTKKQTLEDGYKWHDLPTIEHQSTIKAKDLPDNIKNIDDSILKETIKCSADDCAGLGVFRIIPKELKFYKKHNLPLPRLCPECRHRERIKQRNPIKLWERQCMKKGCPNTFQTTYAPERPEIIYCESCYNKKVS
ncbi:MAG: hypothetical protein HQ537_01845 [Parcubacteria group bacterium]|nr:hypothetical protein [Parcubacteria group bacterium]